MHYYDVHIYKAIMAVGHLGVYFASMPHQKCNC